jgi:hypothetical protein
MIEWIIANWDDVAKSIAAVIGFASIIVKLTPTLKDDNIFLPIVKFIGKFIALNKTVDEANRPK